jgi:acetoin:2,6-dichlorophenolindophenol oxidoreductase subunit alpha
MSNLLQSFRTMLVIRLFEEKVEDLFTSGAVRGTTHPSSGQEAVAVGVCNALRPGDYITSTHRGHGHFLARGADPNRAMAELFGKAAGYSRGRGGSQFMADFDLGFVGGNGITGGSLPTATGLALSSKLRGTGKIAVCFFGDGASNQGTFHESLNMAGLWNLPVLFVCENNRYAMSLHVSKSVPITQIADRAASYGFPGTVVDGNDVEAVERTVTSAAERARALEGPTLIECETYRISGHSRGDRRVYRTREEEAAQAERDPIVRLERRLLESGEATADDIARIRGEAGEVVAEAVRFAEAAPYPDEDTLLEGIIA